MTPAELARLAGLPMISRDLYATALRPRADGAGRICGVTWAQIGAAMAVDVPGIPRFSPDRFELQRALTWLIKRGLVVATALRNAGAFALEIDLPLFAGEGSAHGAALVKASNGAACSRTPARDPAPVDARSSAAPALVKASNGAACSRTPAPVDVEAGDRRGFPSLSPLHSPPYKPPSLPPLYSHPSPQPPAEFFQLEAPPSRDEPAIAQTNAEQMACGRIPEHWIPTPATMKALAQKGIPPERARREIGAFIVYWTAEPGKHAAKRAAGWQLAFLKWCVKLVPQNPTDPHSPINGGSDRPSSASARNAAAVRAHVARGEPRR